MKTALLAFGALLSSLPVLAASNKPVISCFANKHVADGRARIDFFYDNTRRSYSAVYTVSGYAGSETHQLPVCSVGHSHAGDDQGTPLICHDVNWNRTYTVETKIGTYAGVDQAVLKFRDNVHGTSVLGTFQCAFTDN